MHSNLMPVTWFDVVAIAMLFLGIRAGRQRGMSREWLPCLQWIVILFGGALVYRPLGDMLMQTCRPLQLHLGKSFFYITVYLAVAAISKLIFTKLREALPEKWTGGTDIFGKSEYYLGMLAATFRYFCITFAFLAVLNGPFYSSQEIEASQAFQQKWYGSDFFPTLQSVQHSVFRESIVGKTIHDQAGVLLIASFDPPRKSH